ncbi:hypothetical protein [Phenylobacterium sp.]|uniref:hypothetical protein n=1 Tax=Phenylobacterium sp. TaxID=1871053 RepID=UPI0035AF87D6
MAKKRNKVPKRIAGVKVPKAVRRGLKDLARSQNGKTVIAEALLAAGALLAAVEAKPGSAARRGATSAGRKLKPAAVAATAAAVEGRASLAAAFEHATRSFTEALRSPRSIATREPPTAAH